jgi:hypothetical protein
MQSRTTRRFWRLFSALPDELRPDAKHAYRFLPEQSAPRLAIEKLEGESGWTGKIRKPFGAILELRSLMQAATDGEAWISRAPCTLAHFGVLCRFGGSAVFSGLCVSLVSGRIDTHI